MQDGQLEIVPEEVAILRRMRTLLLGKRSWRGVATELNREGHRTRGWDPVERDGRVIRKGHAPKEWTSVSAKRVLLQPINTGALVYNRRQIKGRTHVPRHVDEHIIVEGFCEPIFTRAEMDELLGVATEIAGTPPARTGSTYMLSGLVFCRCGSRMYPVKNYVTTKRGRHSLVYYRCRRASHSGTCDMRQVPASVLEPAVIAHLEMLELEIRGTARLTQAAEAQFAAEVQPLVKRRSELNRQLGRLDTRAQTLLELVEDRLVGKEEFAARRQRLEAERIAARADLSSVDAQIDARARHRHTRCAA